MRPVFIPEWMVALAAIFTVAPLSTVALHAQSSPQVHLHLDPAKTAVHFTLKDTVHTVVGTFRMESADITIDPASGLAHGAIRILTNSGDSGNATRDSKMKKQYLETAKFPTASFEPQKVTGFSVANTPQTAQSIQVAGIFTLHGDPHPLTLNFEVKMNGAEANATTQFKIPYVAWGIKDPSIPFIKVEKEVLIDIDARGSIDGLK